VFRIVLLALALTAAGSLTTAIALPPSTSEDGARLSRGEILVSTELPVDAASGAQGGTARALVHAAPSTVWAVLVDYPGHSGLFPRVVAAEVLEARRERTLVRYVLGIGPFSFGFHVNNYPDSTRRRLEWRLATDRPNQLFRASSGYWRLEPVTDGVVLTYSMAARTVLPAFVTRGTERDGLVETISAVRARAEQWARAPGEPPGRGGEVVR
jgi:hypothetical protein